MSIAKRMQRSASKQPSSQAFIPNAINNPSSAGYRDASNTGVPSGTSLTNSGSRTVTQNGAVLQNLNITGQVVIKANNVTIRNCRITCSDYYPIDYDGYTGLLVEDTEIAGLSYTVTAGMSFSDYTARRVYIHGTADGFKANSNVLIEDCYVTDLAVNVAADTHNDGVQTTGGSGVTIRHSTFKLGGNSGVSAVIQIGNEGGANSNWLVENNLLDGGGYVINANGNQNTNFRFLNNRFTRRFGYGVGDVNGSVFSGNYFDDNQAPIS